MRKYAKEFIIFLLQMLMFYLFPLAMPIYQPMGIVLMILLVTLILSVVLGVISKVRLKYLYPIAIAIFFLPTVFIYYNESALIHSVWYLVISSIGLLVGVFIGLIIKLHIK